MKRVDSVRPLVAAALLPFLAAAPAGAAGRDRCGTRRVTEQEAVQLDQELERFRADNPGRPGMVTVPVWMHVINQGAGYENGDVPDTMLREQVRVLNESFGGRTGGASTSFRFTEAQGARMEAAFGLYRR